ncbi:MAG TPA: TraR/DksA C4-type zinc finger protein [Turneriella sp.]|mgnify:FL=1|nr:TraR/DksA C4-type zinc finger protein [Turneriella sp.]HNA77981.1 TraR/DksA C4-type zinc finger protein [Turneriella sp.]HNE18534.1 TraR/DksA C4-type zinc finger protein [Turneriella sp.]HNJ66218.1 TraR/DksA C4-type zinc finger protein [Turneriella sp.]HNL10613.1 TraR/DksA C4-type zinc finger protein [Turneriella sp.]
MDIASAKKNLETLRQQLLGRVSRIEDHIRRDGKALDQDSEEAVVEKENDAVLDGLDAQGREELAQIDHALGRIASGQYQVCSKCGSGIGAERLQSLPYTTICVKCA